MRALLVSVAGVLLILAYAVFTLHQHHQNDSSAAQTGTISQKPRVQISDQPTSNLSSPIEDESEATADEDNNGGMPRRWVTLRGHGFAIQIDLNSVDRFGSNKLATTCVQNPSGFVNISECRRYLFDCKGHYLDFGAAMSGQWIDAQPRSIADRLAKLACGASTQ